MKWSVALLMLCLRTLPEDGISMPKHVVAGKYLALCLMVCVSLYYIK